MGSKALCWSAKHITHPRVLRRKTTILPRTTLGWILGYELVILNRVKK